MVVAALPPSSTSVTVRGWLARKKKANLSHFALDADGQISSAELRPVGVHASDAGDMSAEEVEVEADADTEGGILNAAKFARLDAPVCGAAEVGEENRHRGLLRPSGRDGYPLVISTRWVLSSRSGFG